MVARLNGVQEVSGSNPDIPTMKRQPQNRNLRFCFPCTNKNAVVFQRRFRFLRSVVFCLTYQSVVDLKNVSLDLIGIVDQFLAVNCTVRI